MLASEVIDRARDLLGDPDTGSSRWTDADLVRWLNDGQRKLVSLRPDVLLSAIGTLATVTDVSATTDTMTVGTDWREALADYVCYRAFARDAANADYAKRAATHLQLFAASVGG